MNNIPKIFPKRNEYGLLDLDYIFNEDGTINYKEMLFKHPEFIVPNKNNFEKRNEKVPDSIKDVKDKDLLVLLAGYKHIAHIRGFSSVEHYVFSSNQEFVSGKCSIIWIPNYEYENKSILFEETADASTQNTSGFGKIFLTTICGNRAFVRCVRNFLKIPILGSDEVSENNNPPEEQPDSVPVITPIDVLKNLLEEEKYSFDKLKEQMVKKAPSEDEKTKVLSYNSINDIPKPVIFDLIGKIKKRREKKSINYNPVPE